MILELQELWNTVEKKEDNSYEDKRLSIDNSTLMDIICDDSLHIIF